jgi:ParB family transcriptional regulator, chromosome partitioning protein
MAEVGMRKALGRGLEALFPGTPTAAAIASQAASFPALSEVSVGDIVPNPEQPRRHFDPDALASLAESVRQHGLLQPLVVRRVAGHYELIAGERRLRAAAAAGLETVPVVVREGGPEERLELAIIENVQRQNLTALEEAEAYRHLIDAYGLTQEEVATRVGKSRPAITNALRLLGLPDAVKARLESGELSAAHARAVLAVDEEEQVTFAEELATARVSKAEAERRAQDRRSRPKRGGGTAVADVHLRGIADELTRGLGTRVRIQRRARGGVIEIEFYSDAELNRLVDRLRTATSPRV